jgi:cytochrome c-type biogenesis protein CcmH/NrfG
VHELVDGAGRGDLRTVLPLEQYPRPYWESAAPPLFLLAARLQREARWPELERLAEQWRRQDPADGEPWYLLGAALLRQGRDDAARQALQCALRLQPGRSAARALLQGLPATAGGSDCPIQPS